MNRNKVSVAFVHNTLEVGGIERALINLLNCLDYSKMDVDLIITSFGQTLINEINTNVNIYFYTNKLERLMSKGKNNVKSWFRPLWVFLFKIYLRTIGKFREVSWARRFFIGQLPHKKYDVLFALNQEFVQEFSLQHMKAIKKYAFYHHGNIEIFNEFIDNFKQFDGIVTVSTGMQDLISASHPELTQPVHIMYNIVSRDKVMEQSKFIIPALHNDENCRVLVSCGRLDPIKGFDLLIDAAYILKKERKHQFKVYVIGDGSERSNLEKRIKQLSLEDTVYLLGQKINPYPYMQDCDIYIQPSRVESFGITMVEAQVLGKVVVTTKYHIAIQ